MNVVYVTGNENKAKYFNEMVGLDVMHQAADVEEIQSLDIEEVVIAKARGAFEQLKKPVLVEDTFLIFPVLGRLPGTFIKWFLEEVGSEGLCRLADQDPKRQAVAGAAFCYFDGAKTKVIRSNLEGTIADSPRGDSGFGWNAVFIPDGQDLTLGQMDDNTFKRYYGQIKPFAAVREMLEMLS